MSIFYQETKIYITDLEMQLIEALRKRRIKEKEHPGSIIFHFNDDMEIIKVENREISR